MATVKIKFSVEIDGVNIIEHNIQRNLKRKKFQLERELSTEIINRLNTLYTASDVFNQPWQDLEEVKKDKNPKHKPIDWDYD